jgi:AcrR family transcriptional regulator
LREQQRAYTRQRLIEAAGHVFAERGYPDATIDEIASEAGASRATFYLHFKSKTDLAAAIVEDVAPFAVQRYRLLDDLVANSGSALREKFHGWLADWLSLWSQSAQMSHALLQAAMLEPTVETLRLRQSQEVIGVMERYFARLPEAGRSPARDWLLSLEIMTQRIFALASTSHLPVGDSEVLNILTDMWMPVLVIGQPGETGDSR